MSVEVKINVKVGDKEFELTMDEIRVLRDILDEFLGEKIIHIEPCPQNPFDYPNIRPWETTAPPYYWNQVWCSGSVDVQTKLD